MKPTEIMLLVFGILGAIFLFMWWNSQNTATQTAAQKQAASNQLALQLNAQNNAANNSWMGILSNFAGSTDWASLFGGGSSSGGTTTTTDPLNNGQGGYVLAP